jgi:hypothetical protein
VGGIVDELSDRDGRGSGTSSREVIAAWVVVLVLLVFTAVSFALDHMVTVSDDPVAAIGAMRDENPGEPVDDLPARELRDNP